MIISRIMWYLCTSLGTELRIDYTRHIVSVHKTVVKHCFNTLRPRRNEQHFADDIFNRIFFNENDWISIRISLKFVPQGPINNIPALVQTIAWRRPGDRPLSEPMIVSLLTHICVTRPQWVKTLSPKENEFHFVHHIFKCISWHIFIFIFIFNFMIMLVMHSFVAICEEMIKLEKKHCK